MSKKARRPIKFETFAKEWRLFRKMTQEQIAAATQYDTTTVGRLERFEIAYTQQMLEQIAEALSCTPGDLLEFAPTDPWYRLKRLWECLDARGRDQAIELIEVLTKTPASKTENAA